jgi:hypothetical protein
MKIAEWQRLPKNQEFRFVGQGCSRHHVCMLQTIWLSGVIRVGFAFWCVGCCFTGVLPGDLTGRDADWSGGSAQQSEATLVAPKVQGCGWSSSPASLCLGQVLTHLVIFGSLWISLRVHDA